MPDVIGYERMKKAVHTVIASILLVIMVLAHAAGVGSSPAYAFSNQELDHLLAPIALYPDPLLAAMLPASTYPAEIADADAWLKSGGTVSGIDGQAWDESVKAMAYYPAILEMMAVNPDWTADLGEAFLNQPEDVTGAIQRLRWQARNTGNLESNDKQQVIIDGDCIEIVPAQPTYMYVPQYDASVVYETPWVPGGPLFITFGLGLAIGGWLSTDFDWHRHHVIYHGWNRPGWVNHARPHIHVPNVYINRSRPAIHQTWRHDVAHGGPEKIRTPQPGRTSPGRMIPGRLIQPPDTVKREKMPEKPPGAIFGPRGNTDSFSHRGRESIGALNQRQPPSAPVPRTGGDSPSPRPVAATTPPPRTPSVTFGGLQGRGRGKIAKPPRPVQPSEQCGNAAASAASAPCKGRREYACAEKRSGRQTWPVIRDRLALHAFATGIQ